MLHVKNTCPSFSSDADRFNAASDPSLDTVGLVSGVYDERGSYQKVVNVEIQSDFEYQLNHHR